MELFILLTILLFPQVDHVPEKNIYFVGEEPTEEYLEVYHKDYKH